jgi:hypothetical protein
MKTIDRADDSILEELIEACEAKMASKFGPKEEPKAEEEEPAALVVEVEGEDKEGDDEDLDDDKLNKLLEIYKSMK